MNNRTINRLSRRMSDRKLENAIALGASLLVLFTLMFVTSIAVSSAPLGL